MSRVRIEVTAKGLRMATVEKIVAKLKNELKGCTTDVTSVKVPESRSERLTAALDQVSAAKSDVEGLRDELQEWRDNLPENLQSGSKADELDEAISALEEIANELENAEGQDVNFPSMM